MQNSMEVFTFLFRKETAFLGKFGTRNQNCLFKMKFDTKTNSNMHNSTALFTFLDQKHHFSVNLIQKLKTVTFC